MRRISAQYIFPLLSAPMKRGIIELDEDGTILNLIETDGKLAESESLEFYGGVIVPGFVNAHCHLELSHLKNKFSESEDLADFLEQMICKTKNHSDTEIQNAIHLADSQMWHEGIVAVADISNSDASFETKSFSSIEYHTFVEIFNVYSQKAFQELEKGKNLLETAKKKGIRASLSHHAPYSMSRELLQMMKEFIEQEKSFFSIHFLEGQSENELFRNRSGSISDTFQRYGISLDDLIFEQKSCSESILPFLPKTRGFFVHNTHATEKDVECFQNHNPEHFFVLCPQANLFIEKKLPDIKLLASKSSNICIGTDGLTSNRKLSILAEIRQILESCPEQNFANVLTWACLGGARALGIENRFGKLEVGLKPGILLIEPFDFQRMTLLPESQVKRLA